MKLCSNIPTAASKNASLGNREAVQTSDTNTSMLDLSSESLRASTLQLYRNRRLNGLSGAAPELREDHKVKEFIKTLSTKERKDWSDKEIVHLTRGIIFGLKACGVEENNLDQMTRYGLRCTYRNSFMNRLKAPLQSLREGLKTAGWGAKLSTPLLVPMCALMGAADATLGLFNRSFARSGIIGNSIGYHGSPVGSKMMINAKSPIDLAYVAAHETCHMMQSENDNHSEYFSHVVHTSLLALPPFRKGSRIWDWDPVLSACKGKYTDYEKAFPRSAAAVSIIRTKAMLEGSEKAIDIIRQTRFLSTTRELKELYVSSRKNQLG